LAGSFLLQRTQSKSKLFKGLVLKRFVFLLSICIADQASSKPAFLDEFAGTECTLESESDVYGYLELRSAGFHSDIHFAYRLQDSDPGLHHSYYGFGLSDQQIAQFALATGILMIAGPPFFLALPFLVKNRGFLNAINSALMPTSYLWILCSERIGTLYKPSENAVVDIRINLNKEQVRTAFAFLAAEYQKSKNNESVYKLGSRSCVTFGIETLELVTGCSLPLHLLRNPNCFKKPLYSLASPYGVAYLLGVITHPLSLTAFCAYHLYQLQRNYFYPRT
jgi:hypothetical protein